MDVIHEEHPKLQKSSSMTFRSDQDYYTIVFHLNKVKQLHYMGGKTGKNTNINYWSNNKHIWFSREIIETDSWKMISDTYTNNIYENLSLLLQYDQFNRHPSPETVDMRRDEFNTQNQHKYRFATYIALNMIHNPNFNSLQHHEKVFTLLTLRHNSNLSMKYLALTKIKKEIAKTKEETDMIPEIYLRFLKATIMDIQKWKTTHNHFVNTGFQPELQSTTLPDDKTYVNIYEHIQEYILKSVHPFERLLDEKYLNLIQQQTSTTQRNKETTIYKQTKQHVYSLLQKRFTRITDYKPSIGEILNLLTCSIQEDKQQDIPHLIVSISGGVDSMLISYILREIQVEALERNNTTLFNLSCVHISYGNRDECSKECEFLQWWCKNILQCPLYIRIIDEIQRDRSSQLRSLYEDVTRRIRFDMYDYVCQQVSFPGTEPYTTNINSYIVLGHNKDDCEENIFSNLSKNIHFDNLYGMKEDTVESSIQLWRPFLDIPKSQIYQCAEHKYIPYLADSTPPWSQRGKMRNQLIPQIESFNPQILPGLHNYIQHTNFLQRQWEKMFETWRDSVIQKPNILYFATNVKSDIPHNPGNVIQTFDFFRENYMMPTFWVRLWFSFDLSHRPSNKSILNLIQYINQYLKFSQERKCHSQTFDKKCTLNKYYTFYVLEKTNLYVLEKFK